MGQRRTRMQHNRTITMRNANVHVHHIYIISMMQNSGVPYRVQPPASTTPPINGNAKGVVSVHIKTVSEDILPDSLPARISAPSCRGPSAKRRRLGGLRRTKPRSRRTLLEARRRARQSIREYELIWLLQQRLRAVSWPHWRLRCMQPLHGHGMGVVRP